MISKNFFLIVFLVFTFPFFGQNLLVEGDFEGLSGNFSTSTSPWSEHAGDILIGNGANSLGAVGNHVVFRDGYSSMRQSFSGATIGAIYTFTIYVRYENTIVDTNSITVDINDESNTAFAFKNTFILPVTPAATYVKHTYTFTAQSTSMTLNITKSARTGAINNQVRIDDVSLVAGNSSYLTASPVSFTFGGSGVRNKPTWSNSIGATVNLSAAFTGDNVFIPATTLGPINAGSFHGVIRFLGALNSAEGYATHATNFTTAPVPIAPIIGVYTFNGSPQGPQGQTAFTPTPQSGQGTFSYLYSGTDATTYISNATRPSNAGTYNAEVTVSGLTLNYSPITSATAFTISKANQTITAIASTENKVFGDPSYSVATTANSGLTVTYSSSNPLVATVDLSGNVTIIGAGSTTITASQIGDDNYFAASDVSQNLTIDKAILLITADSQSVCSGIEASVITAAGTSTVSGFVNSEDESVITGITTYTTSYTSATAAGTADIVITPIVNQLSAANYQFIAATGAITIDPSTTNTSTICEYDTYTWAVNNETYTASGSYSVVLPNCVTEILNLTIIPKPIIITQPITPSICNFPGSTATMTVNVQSALTPSYSWYSQLADSTDWILLTDDPTYQGTGTASLTITKTILTIPDFGFKYFPLPGTKFKVEIAAGGCASLPSNEVVLNEVVMSSPRGVSPVALLTPKLTICTGSTVDLRLGIQSVGDIQWQSSIDNVNWTNEGAQVLHSSISGINPILYFTSGILTQDTWFRVIASNGICDPVIGEATKITVSSPPIAGIIAGGDVTVCEPLGSGFDNNGTKLTAPITNNTVLSLTNVSNFGTIVWERSTNYVNDANVAVWTSVVNFVGTTLSVAYAGAGTTELTVGNLAVTTYYRAVVTNGACIGYSNIVKITVSPTAKIGVITSNSTSICPGEDITFTSTAITANSFRWEISTTSSLSGYSTISGATGLQYTLQNVTSASATGKIYIRTVATGDCNSVISRALTVTVNPVAIAGVVTGGGSVCANSSGTLSVSTQVGTILQWESSSNGIDFVNVPTGLATAGETYISGSSTGITSRYLVTNITADTFFRVKTTSGTCSEAYSNVIKYEVIVEAIAGTVSTTTPTICAGSGATLTLNNSAGTITWKKSINWTATTPSWKTISSTVATPITNNKTILGTGKLITTTAYQATVTIGSCSVVLSNIQIIAVNQAPKSGTVAVNTLGTDVCSGGSKSMKVTSSVGSIQWQRSTTSATEGFEDVVGATTTPYNFENITVPTWFRVVATNNFCAVPAVSTAVQISVTSTPAIAGTISGNQLICRSGATSLFLSGSEGTIVWQKATVINGIVGAFTNVLTSTAITITNDGMGGSVLAIGSLIASTAYRVMLTSGSCVSYTPNYIVSVSPVAKVTSITGFNTASTPLCTGDTAILSLAPGQVGTIEWLSSATLSGVYSPIAGATNSTYNYTPSAAGTMFFKVRMTSSPCAVQALTITGVAVFATSCNQASSRLSSTKTKTEQFTVKAFPNPFASAIQFDIATNSKSIIEMKVYDSSGKLVEVRYLSSSEMTDQDIGENYSSGIYNVMLTQGEYRKSLRVIKK